MLQDMGFSFSITPNGKEAISTLGKAQPDQFQIILMDCQMPEMDRYEATARIRSGKAGACYSDIPIIALTANALSGDKQKCLDSGMNDYLTKPIELESLTNVFQKWL